jgi:ribosomal protein S18 acetylase RimI-like enzyme
VRRSLWLELHRHERRIAASIPFAEDGQSWRRRRQLYVRSLQRGEGFLVVARSEARVVGYAFVLLEEGSDDTFRLGEQCAELYSLSVAREWRSQGVGTRLLDFVDAELAARGIHDLRVAVMVGNSDAQRLSERRGLQPAEMMLYRFGGSADPAPRGHKRRCHLVTGTRIPPANTPTTIRCAH